MKKEDQVKSKEDSLKKIFRFASSVAFVADLITIVLFIKDLLVNGENKNGLTQVIIIVFIFAFAFLLLLYSKSEYGKSVEIIMSIFGWSYVVFSAFVLVIFSIYFINGFHYSFFEYLGYSSIIIIIAFLGIGIIRAIDRRMKYFSIPYMIVALIQIITWVVKIYNHELFTGDFWTFVGTLFLFILSSSFVLGLINYDRVLAEGY